MAKRKVNKAVAERQARWDHENAQIENFRKLAPKAKIAARQNGYNLPFFEFLDSYEAEFKKLVESAKQEFPRIYGVFEVEKKTLDNPDGWRTLGPPATWKRLRLTTDDATGKSYTTPDDAANLRGSTTVLRDPDGNVHYVIQVLKNPDFAFLHRDHRYGLKVSVLLHEVGHVKDYEQKVNLDYDTGACDIIKAEVYANIYALDECYRRGYFTVGDTLLSSIAKYEGRDGYRREVATRLLQRFRMPEFKRWNEVGLNTSDVQVLETD